MRISESQRRIVKSAVARIVGEDSRVWLFGSRADDARRGGDIDLRVETPCVLPDRVGALCHLEGALVMGLGDRKIDVLLKDARTADADLCRCESDGGVAVSGAYLAEHAGAARIALDLAKREAAHLRYTWQTLYAQPVDLAWVESLDEREDLSEKVDAFVGRVGRLQDHIGEKLLPAFAAARLYRAVGWVGHRRMVDHL